MFILICLTVIESRLTYVLDTGGPTVGCDRSWPAVESGELCHER